MNNQVKLESWTIKKLLTVQSSFVIRTRHPIQSLGGYTRPVLPCAVTVSSIYSWPDSSTWTGFLRGRGITPSLHERERAASQSRNLPGPVLSMTPSRAIVCLHACPGSVAQGTLNRFASGFVLVAWTVADRTEYIHSYHSLNRDKSLPDSSNSFVTWYISEPYRTIQPMISSVLISICFPYIVFTFISSTSKNYTPFRSILSHSSRFSGLHNLSISSLEHPQSRRQW